MVKKTIPIIIIFFVVINFQLVFSSRNVLERIAGFRNSVNVHTSDAKALARLFCQANGLRHTKTPRGNDDVLMNTRYQAAYSAIIDYCQISTTGNYGETEDHVRRYVGHCLSAQVTPEQCAEVLVTLNKNGWKFMSTATLLTRLNNNRHFFIHRGFLQITLKEKLFLKYQLIPHLDVHVCYHHFNPLTSKHIEAALSTYDSAYDNHAQDLALEHGTVFCKCYEVIGYDEIFVVIFEMDRGSMIGTHNSLCFTSNKFANWRESQIGIIVEATRNNRFTKDEILEFLQFALILATSTWGENQESSWRLEFILHHLPIRSATEAYNTMLSIMHEAIDSGIGEIDFQRFIVDTDHLSLGYNHPLCKYNMLHAILYSSPAGQVHNPVRRQLWRNIQRKSDMIDHLIALVEYARDQGVECDEFTANLRRLEAAFLLNNWEPLLMLNLIRKVHNTGTNFYDGIFCIKLLAVMENSLRRRHGSDRFYNMAHELERTEDNLETLLGVNVTTRCEDIQQLVDGDVDGADFVLQSIVGSRNTSEPYGSIIPNVGTN